MRKEERPLKVGLQEGELRGPQPLPFWQLGELFGKTSFSFGPCPNLPAEVDLKKDKNRSEIKDKYDRAQGQAQNSEDCKDVTKRGWNKRNLT